MDWINDLLAVIPSIVARAVYTFIANVLTSGVFDMLPESPTLDDTWLATLETYAGYIAYFIPVHELLIFGAGLLTCIAVYYSVSIILRLVKIVS